MCYKELTESSNYQEKSFSNLESSHIDSNYFQHGISLSEEKESESSPCINAATLPTEVLIEILSNLSPEGLDTASLVCKNWYEVLTNDASWRGSFQRQFHLDKFNRVSSSLKWRTELITRLDYLRAWRKGHLTNLSFNGTIMGISHLFSDFSGSRLSLFSTDLGVGVVADPTKGKVAKQRIYTNSYQQMTNEVYCINGSRFGLIYGMKTGNLSCTLFSHETRLRDNIRMNGFHDGKVTAVWINQIESPRTTKKLGGISGGEDGIIYFWNLAKGSIIKKFEIVKGVPIINIFCDSKDTVVAVSATGNVYLKTDCTDQFVYINKLPFTLDYEARSFADVDFLSKYLVFANGSHIGRVDFGSSPSTDSMEFDMLSDHPGTVVAFAMDKTNFPASEGIPGDGGRYIACATCANLIYVWLLEGPPSHVQRYPTPKNKIRPHKVVESPFQVSTSDIVSNLPSITSIALNAVVLLVGSYNGVTVAYDVLSGDFLRVVSSRFSKKALNLRNPDTNVLGLLPTTHLEVDSDPANPHGVIVVGSAVQYFDLGTILDKSGVKKKGVRKHKRPAFLSGAPNFVPGTSKGEIEDEIRTDLELMKMEDSEENRQARLESHSNHFATGMSESDQLAYAMMLSEETAEQEEIKDVEDDEDLKLALELSLQDAPSGEEFLDDIYEPSSSNQVNKEYFEPQDNYEDDLELALRLSLAETD